MFNVVIIAGLSFIVLFQMECWLEGGGDSVGYLWQKNFPSDTTIYLKPSQELSHHLELPDLPHVVDLYVRLPEVGEERETNSLEILHRLVDVDDPGVLLSVHFTLT